jgi:hypothetical protein
MSTTTLYPNGSGSATVSLKSWDYETYPGQNTSSSDIFAAILAGDPYAGKNDINQDGTYPLNVKPPIHVEGTLPPPSATINSIAVLTTSATQNTGTPTIQPYLSLSGTMSAGTEVAVGAGNQTITRPGGGSWSYADLANLYAGVYMRSQSDAIGKGHGICTALSVVVTYTMAPVQGIRLAMQTALSSGSGPNIRTFDKMPRTVNEYPACLIFPRAGNPNVVMPRTSQHIEWELTLLLAAWGDVLEAQDTADSYLLPISAASIQLAIESATYGTTCSYAHVRGWRDYGHLDYGGGGQYFGVRFDVETY